ncbi:sigma-E factor negative regulatory protein RseA [Vibrio gazogenes DSM 21264]|uniref:Anti-sigma-E factor RseA n=2 Tax=Vibrio gazogenes TaxID=687 RepID=A0A1M5CQ62_VIBGA|nr:sigma-E factor negative regulatory protein RseA [Vibrio gazogenes DSM 21264] [Vibrio gazogenes DSM 21264 = NBRC 103151]
MVNKMADKEKLSALMDGELIDRSLISDLSQDHEGLETWRNYHMIGDVMRGDTPQGEWDIASRVALALEDEPIHRKDLAYEQHNTENPDTLTITPLESQPSPKQSRRQLPAWLGQLGQVAVAACVSLVVIVGVQQYQTGDGVDGERVADNGQLPVLQTVPLSGTAEPVSLTRDSMMRHTTENSAQEQRRRVNAMLQDYELQLKLYSEQKRESSVRSGENQELVVE